LYVKLSIFLQLTKDTRSISKIVAKIKTGKNCCLCHIGFEIKKEKYYSQDYFQPFLKKIENNLLNSPIYH